MNKTIEAARKKANDYNVTVTYGPQREISCDYESWTISATIRTDADLPEMLEAIEARTWPEMCKAKAWI